MYRLLFMIAGFLLLFAAGSFGNALSVSDKGAVEFDCLIEPHMVVDISSPVAGTIDTIQVKRSDFVKKGQVLVELNSDVEKATVDLARARVKMDGELKAKRMNFEFEKRQKARFNELFKKKAVSLNQKDEIETQARLAGLELQQAKESQQLAELELTRSKEMLAQRTIRSPIDGVVVNRMKAPGEFVSEEPVLTLAQIDPLNVEVIVPVSYFGAIKKGATAQIFPETSTSKSYQVTVSIVDRVVDASSGTFGVRLELPNPDHQLPGGLKCRVRF